MTVVARGEAQAPPNIALAKYWGKHDGPGNTPAVPSLSVTLQGLETKTLVELIAGLSADELVLNGEVTTGRPLARAARLLAGVRVSALPANRVYYSRVTSVNNFPTASGLASSASGFAALALAAAHAYGAPWDRDRVATCAREASASAARSLYDGFVELVPHDGVRTVADAAHLPLELVVCVTTEEAKSESSSSGMDITKNQSPYYSAWLDFAPRNFAQLRAALLASDLEATCALAEASALAMHASALAAGVSYFLPATQQILAEVFAQRRKGMAVWATMDAGPHVKLLVPKSERETVAKHFADVPGVVRQIVATPGKGAVLIGVA